MQKKCSQIVVISVSVLLIGPSVSSFGQTAHPRQPVSDAAVTAKHGPSIAAVSEPGGGEARLLCMWEVRRKAIIPGAPSMALRLDYAVAPAAFDQNGNLTWTIKGEAPFPSQSTAEIDPSVAPIIFHEFNSGETRFVGAGAAIFGQDFEPYVLRTNATDDFALIDDFMMECSVRNTRLGSTPGEGLGAADWVHLLGRNRDSACGLPDQVFLRKSLDGGATWDLLWTPVVDEFNFPIIGFPSRPVLSIEDVNSAMFSYADLNATFIRAASAQNIEDPAFFDAGMNEMVFLDPDPGEDYFDASQEVIAGNFAIGPFTNMDDATTKLVVMAFHDLTDEAPVQADRDFDAYLLLGQRTDTQDPFTWSNRIRVNTDDIEIEPGVPDPRSDQFMPAVVVDSQRRVHVAWYDTRNDLQSPGSDLRASLYYRRGDVDFNGVTWDAGGDILLDQLAFSTAAILDKTSVGNLIDITMTPDEESAIVVYMGSGDIHSSGGPGGNGPQGPGGPGGGDPGGGQTVHERIYSIRVEQ